MRLSDLYDSLGEITDERILSGMSFYVSPRDRSTRARIETLRKHGHQIESLGDCRFRRTERISDKIEVDGAPFVNNKHTAGHRYRLQNQGYRFEKVRKGVYRCSFNPFLS